MSIPGTNMLESLVMNFTVALVSTELWTGAIYKLFNLHRQRSEDLTNLITGAAITAAISDRSGPIGTIFNALCSRVGFAIGRIMEEKDYRNVAICLKSSDVVIGHWVGNYYFWSESDVPFASLERFVRTRVEGIHSIKLEDLRVTEDIAETLVRICQSREAPELSVIRADLSRLSNATWVRLLNRTGLVYLDNARLPLDLDTTAMLRRCRRLSIKIDPPIRDTFSFQISAFADYLSAGGHNLFIHEDYIEGSWYSLWEELRDTFLASPEPRAYSLQVNNYSRNARPGRREQRIVRRTSVLRLSYTPSIWDRNLKRHFQSIRIVCLLL